MFKMIAVDGNSERNMNWLTTLSGRKSAISCVARRRRICGSMPGLWPTGFYKDVETNQFVIPGSNFTCAWARWRG